MSNVDLELHDLSKFFEKTIACDKVSMKVFENEFVTLLGPSGCGKTTTLRLIAGFLEADEGSIFIRGVDVTNVPAHKRNTGMVFQDWALFPHMSVYDNVAFGLRMRKKPKSAISKEVKEALEIMRLSGLERRSPSQLSGGQQQRVALARALVIRPTLLLLDEPLSNLDAKLREDMRVELKLLQTKLKITTIFVTHDQEEALVMSDRITVMNGGRIEATGRPIDMYNNPPNEFVSEFIGRANFFDGTVSDDGFLKTQDISLKLPIGREYRKGDEIRAIIRPESIILKKTSNGSTANILPGVTEFVAFLGSTIRYVVRLEEGPKITVEKPNESREPVFRPGEHVYVEIDSENLYTVPARQRQ